MSMQGAVLLRRQPGRYGKRSISSMAMREAGVCTQLVDRSPILASYIHYPRLNGSYKSTPPQCEQVRYAELDASPQHQAAQLAATILYTLLRY